MRNDIDAIVERHDSAYINGEKDMFATGDDSDGFYDEHCEYDHTLSLTQEEWLKLQGLTQEEYDRQCDMILEAQQEDWELKRQEAAERARRWTWYGF